MNVWKTIPTLWCAGSDRKDTEMPQPKMTSVRRLTVKNEVVFCNFYVMLVFFVFFYKKNLYPLHPTICIHLCLGQVRREIFIKTVKRISVSNKRDYTEGVTVCLKSQCIKHMCTYTFCNRKK